MSAQLQKLGFKVILKKNADLRTMEEAMGEFGNSLKRGEWDCCFTQATACR